MGVSAPAPIDLADLPDLPENWQDQLGPDPGDWISLPLGPHGHKLLVIRHKGQCLLFLNRCPHAGHALDDASGRIWNKRQTRLVCGSHQAEFRLPDGKCVAGPCKGSYLRSVAF